MASGGLGGSGVDSKGAADGFWNPGGTDRSWASEVTGLGGEEVGGKRKGLEPIFKRNDE